MRLGYFTEDAYDRLLNDIDNNKPKYRSETNWLESYFLDFGQYCKQSSVSVNTFNPYYAAEGALKDKQKAEEDLENVRRLHKAFNNLTPWQASNKLMWTYLCHANLEYRRYIQHRWLNGEREDTIKERFFVTTQGSLLNDNALSRLWWYGHLTYDETAEDPYWLTAILLTNLTICTDIIDTFTRTNPSRLKGVLMAVAEFERLHSKKGLSDIVRKANKMLNRYAAVTAVELLNTEEMRDLYLEFLNESK